jgi:antitoxin CcdA
LRVARSRQRWLQRGQIYLKFRPLRGLPKVHEAYFTDLRFIREAQKPFLCFMYPHTCFKDWSKATMESFIPPVQPENVRVEYAHTYMRMEITMTATHSATRVRTSESGKRAVNLSLSNDVLEAAKHLAINISQVCDSHLREVVRREQERKWREDHTDFIAAYNATIEAEGLPLDEWRSF